jgi:hypothetical protein
MAPVGTGDLLTATRIIRWIVSLPRKAAQHIQLPRNRGESWKGGRSCTERGENEQLNKRKIPRLGWVLANLARDLTPLWPPVNRVVCMTPGRGRSWWRKNPRGRVDSTRCMQFVTGHDRCCFHPRSARLLQGSSFPPQSLETDRRIDRLLHRWI